MPKMTLFIYLYTVTFFDSNKHFSNYLQVFCIFMLFYSIRHYVVRVILQMTLKQFLFNL
jgi:hypothetical protein